MCVWPLSEKRPGTPAKKWWKIVCIVASCSVTGWGCTCTLERSRLFHCPLGTPCTLDQNLKKMFSFNFLHWIGAQSSHIINQNSTFEKCLLKMPSSSINFWRLWSPVWFVLVSSFFSECMGVDWEKPSLSLLLQKCNTPHSGQALVVRLALATIGCRIWGQSGLHLQPS